MDQNKRGILIHISKLLFMLIIFLTLFFSCEESESSPQPSEVTFVEFQEIEPNDAFDCCYFSIEDNHFLAVANYRNDTTYNIVSMIYIGFDNTT
jgi:hypothetical protein